jgi:hypothetical protein
MNNIVINTLSKAFTSCSTSNSPMNQAEKTKLSILLNSHKKPLQQSAHVSPRAQKLNHVIKQRSAQSHKQELQVPHDTES